MIEDAIKDTVGESANKERLNKCMEEEDWSNFTIQQALQRISTTQEMNLDTEKMIYRNKSGDIKDFNMHKKAMKILAARKLLKKITHQICRDRR